MITREELETARRRAAECIRTAGFPFTRDEEARIEVADFGLGNLEVEGAQILTLIQTERIGVKLIVLFPHQSLPEHWHPRVGNDPGKEETVRGLSGTMLVYRAGGDTMRRGAVPAGKERVYTVRNELPLRPGEQLSFRPGEKHWFQAGGEGAVVFSFSSVVRDALDGFTDPAVRRQTVVQG